MVAMIATVTTIISKLKSCVGLGNHRFAPQQMEVNPKQQTTKPRLAATPGYVVWNNWNLVCSAPANNVYYKVQNREKISRTFSSETRRSSGVSILACVHCREDNRSLEG